MIEDEKEYFPKRSRLEITVSGAASVKVYSTSVEVLGDIEKMFKAKYSNKEVSFAYSSGKIEIIPRPDRYAPSVFGISKTVTPHWFEDIEFIWGRGYDGSIYVADKNFNNVVRVSK